jgi:hypothetical protein
VSGIIIFRAMFFAWAHLFHGSHCTRKKSHLETIARFLSNANAAYSIVFPIITFFRLYQSAIRTSLK